jgi:transposase-like protein
MAELAASNYSAVGRKYGVSDNAIRKWVRAYEHEWEVPMAA